MNGSSMFRKILIANRGEIACRIADTAREMGIATVAVYSDADRYAAHVAACDEAVHIGPAAAAESYLVIAKIIDAAKRTGAEAIHPGYGFLAENAGFAEAIADAGLTFIGPPASAIRAMGGKSEAKALMAEADVPLVPGYHGDDQTPDVLARAATEIGFPLLIKASAGGGGKGMKVVSEASGLTDAIASAQREAQASFGDPKVLIERYLATPRHVEIQVFADSHGNCVHLFERDCSIQRRHQKVVEEAPAPGLTDTTRAAMGAAAVRAAQAIGYTGAGTVEFLLDTDGSFYFMEMNTRLQVEHPVTEAITGLDLVEWQLRVAAGEELPFTQDDLTVDGHAIEVRLYAEDPARGFLPQIGTVTRFDVPDLPFTRVDAGIRTGDMVTPNYDPMIAKLIAWGEDRDDACRRLSEMLAGTRLKGLNGNLDFLRRVIDHPAFRAADLDTRFIENHEDALLQGPEPSARALADAALSLVAHGREERADTNPFAADGWLGNLPRHAVFVFEPIKGESQSVSVQYPDRINGEWLITVGDELVTINPDQIPAEVDRTGDRLTLWDRDADGWITLDWLNPLAPPDAVAGAAGGLGAPMPGKVTAVLVEAGAEVEAGTPLLVLEAMKMEHVIKAPAAGTVTDLPFAVGDQVMEGAALVAFEAAS